MWILTIKDTIKNEAMCAISCDNVEELLREAIKKVRTLTALNNHAQFEIKIEPHAKLF